MAQRLGACARIAAAATLPGLVLSACAFWTGGDAPQRKSISISAPSTIQRPEWLAREVARMDAEAFPMAGLPLKLSYELSPASAAGVARAITPHRAG